MAQISTPHGHTRTGANLTQLFAAGVAIKDIENMTVATERALHSFMNRWVDDTVADIRYSMLYEFEKPVRDTGATLESVYGVYPIPRNESFVRTGTAKMQRDFVSQKTLINYQRTKQNAKELRRSLNNDSDGIDEAGRTRISPSDKNLDISRGVVDTPFHGIGRVKRGNLYAAVGVSTWYAIYPHEGAGPNAIHGPRPFFANPMRRQQKKLLLAMRGGLETSINGKLRQIKGSSVSSIYRASRKG